MSDVMLHGVLQMPPELWGDSSLIDLAQRYSRYVQASERISADELTIESLQRKADHYESLWARANDELEECKQRNSGLVMSRNRLADVCREFVRKCDAGEARSTRSYAEMKDALKTVESVS